VKVAVKTSVPSASDATSSTAPALLLLSPSWTCVKFRRYDQVSDRLARHIYVKIDEVTLRHALCPEGRMVSFAAAGRGDSAVGKFQTRTERTSILVAPGTHAFLHLSDLSSDVSSKAIGSRFFTFCCSLDIAADQHWAAGEATRTDR
jgi:hypothetical protein